MPILGVKSSRQPHKYLFTRKRAGEAFFRLSDDPITPCASARAQGKIGDRCTEDQHCRMLGLNLLVGKRDADLPLACHSALFRNRPHIDITSPQAVLQPLQQAQRIGRLTDAARLVDDQAFPAGVNNVERRPVELRPLSSFEPCQIVDAFKDGLAGRRRPEGDVSRTCGRKRRTVWYRSSISGW